MYKYCGSWWRSFGIWRIYSFSAFLHRKISWLIFYIADIWVFRGVSVYHVGNGQNASLAILCDLFGMVKWPFQRLLVTSNLGIKRSRLASPGGGSFYQRKVEVPDGWIGSSTRSSQSLWGTKIGWEIQSASNRFSHINPGIKFLISFGSYNNSPITIFSSLAGLAHFRNLCF